MRSCTHVLTGLAALALAGPACTSGSGGAGGPAPAAKADAAAGSAAASLAGASKASGPQPIATCAEPIFNYGSVPEGQDVNHVFTIKNTGQGVLKILSAKGG